VLATFVLRPRHERARLGRHRDKDSEIDLKNSDTRVDTLLKTYGDDFLSDFRGVTHLGTVLDEICADSLTELVSEQRRKK
jgi:hypothetical protein